MSMKKRAKALHDFQNDPPTTIFLLSMRAGACGINLTQGNYSRCPCSFPPRRGLLAHSLVGSLTSSSQSSLFVRAMFQSSAGKAEYWQSP
jgi:hypothetical protein